MDAWGAATRAQMRERRLESGTFQATQGDVFIGSGPVLPGGSPIAEPWRIRRSIAFHHFAGSECRSLGARLMPESGGFWIRRSHQPIRGGFDARMRGRVGRYARHARKLFER